MIYGYCCKISPQIKIHTEILRNAGDSLAISLRHQSHYVLETSAIFFSLFSFLILPAALVCDALKSTRLLSRKITLGLVCSTHVLSCIWCWKLMDVFPFRFPRRWIAAVNVSAAQVRSLLVHAVPMVFNPILYTAFKYALFLFKFSWLNPRINAINSGCLEVEQLAAWYCPGGFCICGFSLISPFSKGLCVYLPLSTQPPALCREECGMWAGFLFPTVPLNLSFEDSLLSHFGGRRWLESSYVKYKIRLQPYHLILFPLNAKLWISLEAEWVFWASLQESKNPNSRGQWTEKSQENKKLMQK